LITKSYTAALFQLILKNGFYLPQSKSNQPVFLLQTFHCRRTERNEVIKQIFSFSTWR